jgi:hypothetical protein
VDRLLGEVPVHAGGDQAAHGHGAADVPAGVLLGLY